MNDIASASNIFKFILYADDSTLFTALSTRATGINSITQLSHIVNNELDKISQWLFLNKLSLNVNKTKFMVFHTKGCKIENNIPHIKINNILIENTSTFDFLGITINETLSWNDHADKISNKISKYSGILYRLKRYLPVHIMRLLYCSMVQSHFHYGILAWGHEAHRLKKIQKKIIRTISNSKYNSHTDPIFKSLGLLKLDDIYKLSCLDFYYRYCNELLPNYMSNFELRTQGEIHMYPTRNNQRLISKRTRLVTTRKCIRHQVVDTVNSTENRILDKITTHSIQGFKLYIKKDIINNYDPVCRLQNCYICNR